MLISILVWIEQQWEVCIEKFQVHAPTQTIIYFGHDKILHLGYFYIMKLKLRILNLSVFFSSKWKYFVKQGLKINP